MKILALDTSGKQAGAAIMDKYITIGEILINAQSGPKTWHHSEILMPGVERLFALSGMELSDMDYIAYTSGPGSFTGIRIGAATALGLARGINRPAVQVPTLDALAYNVLCIGEGGIVAPLLDARRGQVYGAVYLKEAAGGFLRLTDYFAASIEEAMNIIMTAVGNRDVITQAYSLDGACGIPGQARNDERPNGTPPSSVIPGLTRNPTSFAVCEGSVIFLGDGACANKPAIQALYPAAQFAPINSNRQRPASVALCAMHQIKNNPKTGTQPVDIIYIRDPQAVRNLKKEGCCACGG